MKAEYLPADPEIGRLVPFPGACLRDALGELTLIVGASNHHFDVLAVRVRKHPEFVYHEISFFCDGALVRVAISDALVAEILRDLPLPQTCIPAVA